MMGSTSTTATIFFLFLFRTPDALAWITSSSKSLSSRAHHSKNPSFLSLPCSSNESDKDVDTTNNDDDDQKSASSSSHSGDQQQYWFDRRIHTLGNRGLGGGLHAALGPVSTKAIDDTAYNGINLRQEVSNILSEHVKVVRPKIVDLCAGTGTSTRALQKAFPDAEAIVGIDTSRQMVSMASFLTRHVAHMKNEVVAEIQRMLRGLKQGLLGQRPPRLMNQRQDCSLAFVQGNAEDTQLPGSSYDLVTIMFGMHEIPSAARVKILQEAERLVKVDGVVAIIDISRHYKASESMLRGEPYILEYQKHFDDQIRELDGGLLFTGYHAVVPKHVDMWILKRTSPTI